MARQVTLDRNELACLRALSAADPDGDFWITHYASGLDLGGNGADPIACTYEGSYAVWKRLIARGLVDKDPTDSRRTNHETGVALNEKGRAALAAAEGGSD